MMWQSRACEFIYEAIIVFSSTLQRSKSLLDSFTIVHQVYIILGLSRYRDDFMVGQIYLLQLDILILTRNLF